MNIIPDYPVDRIHDSLDKDKPGFPQTGLFSKFDFIPAYRRLASSA